MKSPGRRLRTSREAKGLTQKELAAKLGVDAATVSRWESDAIGFGPVWAEEIAKVIGESAVWLLCLEEQRGAPISPEQQAALQLGWQMAELDPLPRAIALLVGRSLQAYAGRHELQPLLRDMTSDKPLAIYKTRRPGRRAKKKGPLPSS